MFKVVIVKFDEGNIITIYDAVLYSAFEVCEIISDVHERWLNDKEEDFDVYLDHWLISHEMQIQITEDFMMFDEREN